MCGKIFGVLMQTEIQNVNAAAIVYTNRTEHYKSKFAGIRRGFCCSVDVFLRAICFWFSVLKWRARYSSRFLSSVAFFFSSYLQQYFLEISLPFYLHAVCVFGKHSSCIGKTFAWNLTLNWINGFSLRKNYTSLFSNEALTLATRL